MFFCWSNLATHRPRSFLVLSGKAMHQQIGRVLAWVVSTRRPFQTGPWFHSSTWISTLYFHQTNWPEKNLSCKNHPSRFSSELISFSCLFRPGFSVQSAKCSDPRDRAWVERTMLRWLLGFVLVFLDPNLNVGIQRCWCFVDVSLVLFLKHFLTLLWYTNLYNHIRPIHRSFNKKFPEVCWLGKLQPTYSSRPPRADSGGSGTRDALSHLLGRWDDLVFPKGNHRFLFFLLVWFQLNIGSFIIFYGFVLFLFTTQKWWDDGDIILYD